MGSNRSRSSEKMSSDVVALENLRQWRAQFENDPLDPEIIKKGLLTLTDIGESALMQAVKYGRKVEDIHASQQQVHGKLELVQAKLDTTISRLESSTSVQGRESESVADELRLLKQGLQEVKIMSRAIIDHFKIVIPNANS
jgi:hypothetical protein